MEKCCGTTPEREANEEIQTICDKMKQHVEKKSGKQYDIFIAKRYMTQLVSGTNYFIKVHVGGDDHFHIRVYEPLKCSQEPMTLTDYQFPKRACDPIEYF